MLRLRIRVREREWHVTFFIPYSFFIPVIHLVISAGKLLSLCHISDTFIGQLRTHQTSSNLPANITSLHQAFEDSYILSNILNTIFKNQAPSPSLNPLPQKIEACFQAYNEVRLLRTQEVTRTSREMGGIAGYAGDGIGRDLGKLKADADVRMNWIWDVDLPGEVRRGVEIAMGKLAC